MTQIQNLSSLEALMDLGAAKTRRNDMVVFIGRSNGRLIDNVKYLYLQALTQDYGFRPVFFTHHKDEYAMLWERGLPVITMDAPGIEALTTAGALVFDDLFTHEMEAFALGIHAKRVQLWHGIPLKKIGFPEIESAVNMNDEVKKTRLQIGYANYDVVASTSPWVTEELFSKVFKAGSFVDYGYPRNDILLRQPGKHDLLNVDTACYSQIKRHKKKGGKVVVYMPTFRDNGADFTDSAGRGVISPAPLAQFIEENDVLFLLKLHPYVNDKNLRGLPPGLMHYPSHLDIYPLLAMADVLVTDYSSVYFDFLLLDKPIVFFAYDLARYISKDRELFFPFDDMTPGPKAATQTQLLEHLSAAFVGDDPFRAERTALRDRLFSHQDADAAHRLCAHIKGMM